MKTLNDSVKKKQIGLLVGIVVGLFGLGSAVAWFFNDEPRIRKGKETQTETIQITSKNLGQEHFVATYGAELVSVRNEVKRLREELASAEKERKDALVPKPDPNDPFEVNINTQAGGPLPPTPMPGDRLKSGSSSRDLRRLTSKSIPLEKKPEEKFHLTRGDSPVAMNRLVEVKAESIIPSGSFVRATLLNGVEAPTGGQAQNNPMPVLIELTDKAFLPNKYRSDLSKCFVTANATGDLSSERVLIRLDRLSCLDAHGGAVDTKITGYVTGEDGKTGLRARVVTRSGQAIASALLVGALSGLGDAISMEAQETTTNFAGVNSTNVRNPWRYGMGKGVADAMDRIADYYLRLADKIFPVLEIDAGRKVDIVITQSASIKRVEP